MPRLSLSPIKNGGLPEIDALLGSAHSRLDALKGEFEKKFSPAALAENALRGTPISQRERSDLEDKISAQLSEIAGHEARRKSCLAALETARIEKMRADKDDLDKKRGLLISRADALRTENDSVDAEIRQNFSTAQQFQRAIASAEAAQAQRVPG